MTKKAWANGPVGLGPVQRREFAIGLASLGAAAILGLPRGAIASPASANAPAWEAVLASLGHDLASGRPAAFGASVCTPSGWVLSDTEAEACRRTHERLG